MAATESVIAIVDDDEAVRRSLKRLVHSLSYKTADFASGEAFLASLYHVVPACTLLDLYMPGLSGLEVLESLRSRHLKIPTIVITANVRSDMRQRCIEAGAVAYLQKPLDRAVVLLSIQTAIGQMATGN